MNAASDNVKDLVDSLVIPDRNSSADKVNREAIDATLTKILDGGKDSLVAVIDMVKVPGKDRLNDTKPRYALHALAVRVARDARQRKAFCEALASTLGSDRPKEVQAFVIRQLQVAGGEESAAALGKLLTDEALSGSAVQALLAVKTGAAKELRTALPRAKGAARVGIVQALGVLRDRDAAADIRKLAGADDRDTRMTAVWALANAGDAGSVDTLIKATAAEGFERTKAASACLLLAERLSAAGNRKDSARLYAHLQEKFTGEKEAHIRDAAKRGLDASK